MQDTTQNELSEVAQPNISASYGRYVSCSHLAVLSRQAESDGVDMAALLRRRGLTQAELSRPNAKLAADQYAQILIDVDAQVSDKAFWFRFAQLLDFPAYDILGQALLSCATLRQGIHILTKYYELFSCGSALTCRERPDGVELFIYRPGSNRSRISYIRSELLCALIFNGMRKVLPDEGRKVRFAFDYAAPAYAHLYGQYLSSTCSFSAGQASIYVPEEYLSLPGLFPNPTMLQIFARQCDDLLSDLRRTPSIDAQVRREIAALPELHLSASEVAQKIGLSKRTMNRRLESAGTSFQEVVRDVKTQLASDYLQATNMSIENIASALGYSDASNFRRAFVGWTGVLPSQFRRADADNRAK